jgi:hypothetical protein
VNKVIMSRYEYEGKEEYYQIVIGWDNPLQTFFAQVWDGRSRSEHPLLWLGTVPDEVSTAEALAAQVEAYGEIPPGIMARLRDDYDRRTSPTPLQLLTRLISMLT